LIFEKINGYKDGSFFTPGFITMYMCREAIRKAVIQKFNEEKQWNCKDMTQLYNKIEDTDEANKIVNSLKICDPAVGSGHFLVSALNEIIAIKNDLRILNDRQGRRLKEYDVEVENDELIVTDEDGVIFEYNPRSRESQRIQEALFHEKQTIIENCLFGVDINPNSVKICRLRLWIELLKNAYYKNENELETLPNIDINIKCGNSLVSRFSIDANLGKALKKSKWTIDSYRLAVSTYRNARSREEKREMERLMTDIKNDFRSEIASNDPKLARLHKIKGQLFTLTNQVALFEQTKKEKSEWNKKVEKLTHEINKLETEIEEIKNNKIYENAFEWRFEFPEVLNEEGDFVGFDVVIGNPPWSSKEQLIQSDYVLEKYGVNIKNLNIFAIFLVIGNHILHSKGYFNMLIPEVFSRNEAYLSQRKLIVESFKIISISNWGQFPDVASNTISLHYSKAFESDNSFIYNNFEDSPSKINEIKQSNLLKTKTVVFSGDINNNILDIISKLEKHPKLSSVCKIKRGIELGQSTNLIKCDNCQKHSELSTKYYTNRKSTTCKHCGSTIIPEDAFSISQPQPNEIYKTKIYSGRLISKYDCSEPLWIRTDLLDIDYKLDIFENENLFVKRISSNPIGTIIKQRALAFNTIYSLYNCTVNKKVVLAIINSTLTEFYYKNVFTLGSTLTTQVTISGLSDVPFPKVIDYIQNERIIKFVDKIFESKNQNPSADTTTLESEIDQLVYELYGLTEEEIGIVEGSVR
ncbi:MAG: TaqI-like C-terminal specificity domain-containing protein, partial [Phycisphaerae bacterium]